MLRRELQATSRSKQLRTLCSLIRLYRLPSLGVRLCGRDLSIRPSLAVLSYDYGRYFVWNVTLLVRLSSSVSWDYHEFWMSGCIIRRSITWLHGRAFLQFVGAVGGDIAVDGFLLIWD